VAENKTTWGEILLGYRLLGFEDFVVDYYKQKNKKKDDVEYFD